jgi:hypothetical protein
MFPDGRLQSLLSISLAEMLIDDRILQKIKTDTNVRFLASTSDHHARGDRRSGTRAANNSPGSDFLHEHSFDGRSSIGFG